MTEKTRRPTKTPEEQDLEIARKTLRAVAQRGKLEFARVAAAKALAALATGEKGDEELPGKKASAVAKAKQLVATKFQPRKPRVVVNNG